MTEMRTLQLKTPRRPGSNPCFELKAAAFPVLDEASVVRHEVSDPEEDLVLEESDRDPQTDDVFMVVMEIGNIYQGGTDGT